MSHISRPEILTMLGGFESVASKSASAAAESIAATAFDFVVGQMHNGLCLVKLQENETPA